MLKNEVNIQVLRVDRRFGFEILASYGQQIDQS